MLIFNIASKSEWDQKCKNVNYDTSSLQKDGFIHCCTFEQLLHVDNNNLKDIKEDLVVLCIDDECLKSELKWEKNKKNGITFPHLYGPINTNAVIDVIDFNKNEDGEFFISSELYNYSNYEKSCGAIIVHKFENQYKTLLINFPHAGKSGWGFPKGHVEPGETEIETAKREIFEEVGLDVEFIPDFRSSTYFCCKKGTTNQAVYYAAISNNETVKIQESEVNDYAWCDFKAACDLITFECDKKIFKQFCSIFSE